MNRILQILIAFDQLLNTFLPNGWADETLSSRAYRVSLDGVMWPMFIIDRLFFWQEQHCKQAYMSEINRRQLPPDMRI